mgnify:CR=1 FL=1
MGICFVFMLKIECFVLPNFFMILFLFKTDNEKSLFIFFLSVFV